MTHVDWGGPIEGEPFALLGSLDLAAAGYVGEEYFLSGAARSYAQVGDPSEDGRWQARHSDEAPFRTRILVRRPKDPARFNGTLVMEWMNVSGGIDAAPDWLFIHRHLMREGAAWVGVSAQKAGIDGGGLVPGMPLKQANAERYGGLIHPGDAFSFDIFSAVARALRDRESGPLGGCVARRVIATGESQSAGFLVTYVNAIDDLERQFDAFLIHGRPCRAAGIDGNYIRASRDGDVAKISEDIMEPHLVRSDLRVPVLVLQSETDVTSLGSGLARQPDGELFRLWEIAGAAHFDSYGLIASMIDDGSASPERLARRMAPTSKPMGMQASYPINSGPQQHYIAQAAISCLERQVRGGAPPPTAPRLETSSDDARAIQRDELGIARGGIRSPWVDAPSAVLSGLGQGGEGFMFLFGTTLELDEATLRRLYPGGPEEHLARFEAATDAALKAGFLLEADADEIRALGRYGRQPSGWRVG
jgi:hypothetical protein